MQAAHPELTTEEVADARRELLRSQRSAFMDLRSDGMISEEAFEKLVTEVDFGLLDATELEVAPEEEPGEAKDATG